MSSQSCTACNDLREYAPEFVLNGTTEAVGDHLTENEGLSGAAGHNDCDDLMDVNDCLIGNMADELDSFDVCEWKDFMGAFIPNLYETLKAMIYAQCGLWCNVDALFNGVGDFTFTESISGNAYCVAGKGVSFLLSSSHNVDVAIQHIAGGFGMYQGTFKYFAHDFTDGSSVYNFDDDGNGSHLSSSRQGNSVWAHTDDGENGGGIPQQGELVCECRIKMSAFPALKDIIGGRGQEGPTGRGYHTLLTVFHAGTYAYGQHGGCSTSTGEPNEQGYSRGHLVPSGWMYCQIRMSSASWNFAGNSAGEVQRQTKGWCGILMNQDNISC